MGSDQGSGRKTDQMHSPTAKEQILQLIFGALPPIMPVGLQQIVPAAPMPLECKRSGMVIMPLQKLRERRDFILTPRKAMDEQTPLHI
ncbi:hypothetical protein D3C73_1269070 [compost metagenome]